MRDWRDVGNGQVLHVPCGEYLPVDKLLHLCKGDSGVKKDEATRV